MQTIDNKLPGGTVVEVREISNGEGTSYRVTLEQKDRRHTLRINSLGEITDWQKGKLKK